MDVQKYIDFDPYLDCDRDLDIRNRKVRVVKTRKACQCFTPNGPIHAIPAGSLVRVETAIVDGEFGSYRTCLGCCDRLMVERKEWRA